MFDRQKTAIQHGAILPLQISENFGKKRDEYLLL